MLELNRAAALLAALTLLAVAGCGHPAKPAAPEVATVRSATASRSAPANLDDLRPLVRPDMTGDEEQQLWTTWGQCLYDHGVPVTPAKANDPDLLKQAQYAPAVSACASKKPENWQDRDARTDPEYDDHFRAEVTCIRGHGIKLDTGADGHQLIVTDDRQVGDASGVIQTCERQAFSAAIKTYNAH